MTKESLAAAVAVPLAALGAAAAMAFASSTIVGTAPTPIGTVPASSGGHALILLEGDVGTPVGSAVTLSAQRGRATPGGSTSTSTGW